MSVITAEFHVIPNHKDRTVTVVPSYDISDKETYRHVLTGIAVNCIKALGKIEGMEGTMERVMKLVHESRFSKLPPQFSQESSDDDDETEYNIDDE